MLRLVDRICVSNDQEIKKMYHDVLGFEEDIFVAWFEEENS